MSLEAAGGRLLREAWASSPTEATGGGNETPGRVPERRARALNDEDRSRCSRSFGVRGASRGECGRERRRSRRERWARDAGARSRAAVVAARAAPAEPWRGGGRLRRRGLGVEGGE